MNREEAEMMVAAEERASEDAAFQGALAAFAEEPIPEAPPVKPLTMQKPNAVPEGDEPATPEPETPPSEEEPTPGEEPSEEQAKSVTPPEKPSEFVKFDKPEQLKRFNDVFGYAKRLERQLEALQRQQAAPQPQPQAQPSTPVVIPPQPFAEPRPKLSDYETVDQWEDALFKHIERREQRVKDEIFTSQSQQELNRVQQQQQSQLQNYINSRIGEGQSKYGMEFDTVSEQLAPFVPYGSTFHETLFGLKAFPQVVMELGKNLQEADRISRLSPHDQIYEIKALEKTLLAKPALAAKLQPKTPTKVEAPGAGEDQRAQPSNRKLISAAKANGGVRDWAKVFANDTTL